MLEMALIENVQRINLNAIERAKAFQQLLHDFQYSAVRWLTKSVSPKPSVSNLWRLLNLPDAVRDGLSANTIRGMRELLADWKIKTDHRCLQTIAQGKRQCSPSRGTCSPGQQAKESTSAAPGKRIVVDPNLVPRWQETIALLLVTRRPCETLAPPMPDQTTITLRGKLGWNTKDLEELLSQSARAQMGYICLIFSLKITWLDIDLFDTAHRTWWPGDKEGASNDFVKVIGPWARESLSKVDYLQKQKYSSELSTITLFEYID